MKPVHNCIFHIYEAIGINTKLKKSYVAILKN